MKLLKPILMIAITSTILACGSKKENQTENGLDTGSPSSVPSDTDTVHVRADTVVVDTTIK